VMLEVGSVQVTALFFAQVSTFYYFAYFLIILPVVSRMETTKPVPESIAQAVLAKQKG